jgi:RNA polymerase sigma-70 factor (ECF subfamily)
MSLHAMQIEPLLPDLKRYARSLARGEDDANDLVQDCVERALVKSDLYREGTNLRSWMFTLMRNVFISQKRRDAVAKRYLQHAMHHGASIALPSQTHKVFLNETMDAIGRLSVQERSAITMLGLEERSHQEAAEETRLPVGTMKSRLSRGRANLRESLRVDGAGMGS